MANLSDFLSSTAMKGTQMGGPGSNGYWRRELYMRPGTYTWTARKRGRVKIQAIGSGGASEGNRPGASGAFGEKELFFEVGQSITIVVGAGGTPNGGTTSISGGPVGSTPLALVGAQGRGTLGAASGPWDLSYPGAAYTGSVPVDGIGAPSSASPFGPGNISTGPGGAGWGGGSVGNNATAGASSHRPSIDQYPTLGFLAQVGQTLSFWDLRDVDSAGGAPTSSVASPPTGPGAGTGSYSGSSNFAAGISTLGGGVGYSRNSSAPANVTPPTGSLGTGGGGCSSTNASAAGGGGFVALFFDEVQ